MATTTREPERPAVAEEPAGGTEPRDRRTAPRPAGRGGAPAAEQTGVVDGVEECFHALLRRLPWPWDGLGPRVRTVGFTSCYRGEGVSSVTAAAALCAAQSGQYRIALVDANLAQPVAHKLFRLAPSPGLAEALVNGLPPGACVQPTRRRNLSVLTGGSRLTAQAFEALDRGTALLTHLKKDYDLVVVDLPAMEQGAAALPWFGLLDGIVLVVEDRRVRREVGQRARQTLLQAGAAVLGVALNKRDQPIPDWLYRTL